MGELTTRGIGEVDAGATRGARGAGGAAGAAGATARGVVAGFTPAVYAIFPSAPISHLSRITDRCSGEVGTVPSVHFTSR